MSSTMPCDPRNSQPEPIAPRVIRPRVRGAASAFCLIVLALAGPRLASAEDRVIVQGLADMEGWNTSEWSLLGRNEGEPSGMARTRLWASTSFTDHLQGFALGAISGGSADEEDGAETEMEQAWVQYSFSPGPRLMIRGGKLLQPVGGFARRYLSSQNPLVGEPLSYGVSYPVGLEVSGAAGILDYLAAVTDKPIRRGYGMSEPKSALRPVVSLGVRPTTGLRFGVYATQGTWVDEEEAQYLPDGVRWRDLQQHVHGLDLSFSRAHLEVRGEITRTRSDVPGGETSRGVVYVLEPKLTISPRWFAALRLESARLGQMRWYGTYWVEENQGVKDLEAGAGFRVDPRLLVKASWRVAHSAAYHHDRPRTDPVVALQLSWLFDVNDWVERRQ